MKGFLNELTTPKWVRMWEEHVGVNMESHEVIYIKLTVVRVDTAICKMNKTRLLFAVKTHQLLMLLLLGESMKGPAFEKYFSLNIKAMILKTVLLHSRYVQ